MIGLLARAEVEVAARPLSLLSARCGTFEGFERWSVPVSKDLGGILRGGRVSAARVEFVAKETTRYVQPGSQGEVEAAGKLARLTHSWGASLECQCADGTSKCQVPDVKNGYE